jgi:phage terminase large subunit-like protein|tara:strand:- start:1740 stop:3275 length:1536 start_codon:yes stop_codon:yes gene_type:complete
MATLEHIKTAAESDLVTFIKLIAPEQMLGQCHEDVCNWWINPEAKSHQLLLFPRDHGKSRLVAFRVAWELTKDPTLRILYISATANLAEKQLGFIKGIITSDIYRRYWPEHVNHDEGKRTRWTNSEIMLDHPLRKKENVRDPSIFTGGLTTSLTGLHCDIAVLDDVVVYENAYTGEGRNKVKSQYSLLSSIEGAEAKEWVVGTRYHPSDLYNDLLQMTEDIYTKDGEKIGEENIYEIFERPVEDRGDGTGQFLWPRQQRKDGKWFGFDIKILAKKRGQYLDKGQFRAQYYSDPTDPDNVPVGSDKFQYFERKHIRDDNGHWFYKEKKLNVFGAVDFAFSLNKKADYTAIVIVGIDSDNNIYVLDIDRFRTDRISDYFEHILHLSNKWSFRKLRAETTVAQMAIVKQLKELIKQHGLSISINEYRPNKSQGNKQERISSILEPRYDNMSIWHYRGGNTQILEEELSSRNPAHDDVIDALASVVDMAVKPARRIRRYSNNVVQFNKKFGGVSF